MSRLLDIFKIWKRYKKERQPPADPRREPISIDSFAKLDEKNRMKTIMTLGDAPSPENFHLLEYAILHDPNKHVKFAALKRIPHFKGLPGMNNLLEQSKKLNGDKALEPYYSLALLKLDLITKAEFDAIFNKH